MWCVAIIDWLEETHKVVKSSFVGSTELDKTFILSSFVHFPKNLIALGLEGIVVVLFLLRLDDRAAVGKYGCL